MLAEKKLKRVTQITDTTKATRKILGLDCVGSYIDISVSRQSSYLQVIIKDFGIGIPKEIMPHLFDFSSSTSRSGTAGETGTGFGLPLAKMFIDKFDGEITVKSDGYSGTTFILKFKISPSHI